jgi:hypothetical protein
LEPGQLPEWPLSTFPTVFERAREPDAEHLRVVNCEEATASRHSAFLKCDHGLWPVRMRSLNVKGVAEGQSIAVANSRTANAVRGADNNKGLPISVAAVGTGGWLS